MVFDPDVQVISPCGKKFLILQAAGQTRIEHRQEILYSSWFEIGMYICRGISQISWLWWEAVPCRLSGDHWHFLFCSSWNFFPPLWPGGQFFVILRFGGIFLQQAVVRGSVRLLRSSSWKHRHMPWIVACGSHYLKSMQSKNYVWRKMTGPEGHVSSFIGIIKKESLLRWRQAFFLKL